MKKFSDFVTIILQSDVSKMAEKVPQALCPSPTTEKNKRLSEPILPELWKMVDVFNNKVNVISRKGRLSSSRNMVVSLLAFPHPPISEMVLVFKRKACIPSVEPGSRRNREEQTLFSPKLLCMSLLACLKDD